MARQSHLCPQQFNKRLRQWTGWSFRRYVENRRIACAMELLVSSQGKVIDIAADVGFGSVVTFYRAVRRQTGRTASACRATGSDAALLQAPGAELT